MKVLVTGATGFVGAHLVAALAGAGHDVRAMTRRPQSYRGPAVAVAGDVGDASSLAAAVDGCDAAYYMVHSLASADFAHRDREGARAFGDAAKAAGVRQVIYLGGLGSDDDNLSEHLVRGGGR